MTMGSPSHSLLHHPGLDPGSRLPRAGEEEAGPRLEGRGDGSGLGYDLLLLDPPYGSGAGGVALDRLLRLGWLAPGALASVETGKREAVEVAGFEVEAERIHGKAKITLLRAPA
ncbi:MAG: RsmD family RNA methyltransferase [Sphingomonadaceae bacterium]|nr:RsmD family RNA methyltransferase [Sphingomonadaceae bacterium]